MNKFFGTAREREREREGEERERRREGEREVGVGVRCKSVGCHVLNWPLTLMDPPLGVEQAI